MPGILQSTPVSYGKAAPEGPRYVDAILTWQGATSNGYYQTALQVNVADAGMSCVQSLDVDNSNNHQDLFLSVTDTGDCRRIPAYCRATFNVITGVVNFSVNCLSTAIFSTTVSPYINPILIRLFNFPQNERFSYLYELNGYGYNIGGVNNFRETYSAPISASVACVAGLSTQVRAADPSRYKFVIAGTSSNAAGTIAISIKSDPLGVNQLIASIDAQIGFYSEQTYIVDQPCSRGPIYCQLPAGGNVSVSVWKTGLW